MGAHAESRHLAFFVPPILLLPPLPDALLLSLGLLLAAHVFGGLSRSARVVPPLADVQGTLESPDAIVVKDGARVHGDLVAPRIVLGNRVRLDGALRATTVRAGRELSVRGRVEIAGRAVFATGLHVEPPAPEAHPITLGSVPIDVPTRHADALLAAFRAVGWTARDTGRTVTTEDDETGLTTLELDVRVPIPERPPPAPELTEAPAIASRVHSADPYVRNALLAVGDLVVGDGLEADVDLSATGDVTVGKDATLSGRIRAGGDLSVREGAVVGDVACGGRLTLDEGARVTGAVEAAGGLAPGTRIPTR